MLSKCVDQIFVQNGVKLDNKCGKLRNIKLKINKNIPHSLAHQIKRATVHKVNE